MGGDLRLYEVTVGSHKTQMRLDEHDAREMGDDAVLLDEAPDPHPAKTHPDPAPADTKSRLVTSNKMRGTDEGGHASEA